MRKYKWMEYIHFFYDLFVSIYFNFRCCIFFSFFFSLARIVITIIKLKIYKKKNSKVKIDCFIYSGVLVGDITSINFRANYGINGFILNWNRFYFLHSNVIDFRIRCDKISISGLYFSNIQNNRNCFKHEASATTNEYN